MPFVQPSHKSYFTIMPIYQAVTLVTCTHSKRNSCVNALSLVATCNLQTCHSPPLVWQITYLVRHLHSHWLKPKCSIISMVQIQCWAPTRSWDLSEPNVTYDLQAFRSCMKRCEANQCADICSHNLVASWGLSHSLITMSCFPFHREGNRMFVRSFVVLAGAVVSANKVSA